ncbi:hypothetical protein QE320_gp096 [Pseudomonas phage EM]|uniref:Uncharacterized protein n=1 Tax=Pseudomonas phage EM TaxID=2936914 RepID=A0AAE9KSL7_9CAUD|nr:hypothetical protein QE320_gp096 [Pseudomonas phage EM]UPW35958.1 hypothetical protein EM_173 [Pseudomonas phage EM]
MEYDGKCNEWLQEEIERLTTLAEQATMEKWRIAGILAQRLWNEKTSVGNDHQAE